MYQTEFAIPISSRSWLEIYSGQALEALSPNLLTSHNRINYRYYTQDNELTQFDTKRPVTRGHLSRICHTILPEFSDQVRLHRPDCVYYLLIDSIITSVDASYLFSCKLLNSFCWEFNSKFCLEIILATPPAA
jgi:hypothetical protein